MAVDMNYDNLNPIKSATNEQNDDDLLSISINGEETSTSTLVNMLKNYYQRDAHSIFM